ncbi:hypothetical protein LB553_08870 [Mesorhizobium sp. CA8]|uniref:hypothetical protein n=1 Tax=Mesorhizobium sp. CA8 TaxID=2876637 RepID=UPI001CCE51AE|nr:hypothetical protein [Mesorhizobium sp. CA8]MBZ9760988.1 hypothetical protein [Mesorhizobium sp. CA8]
MGTYNLDPATRAELHLEAQKLIAKYESPADAVEALMAYNCELETQILAIAHRYPGLVSISFDETHPTVA